MLSHTSELPLRRKFHLAPLGAFLLLVAIGGFSFYQSQQKRPADAATPAKLEPTSLGFVPYAYIPYGGPTVDSARAATGVKQYVMAFINSAGSCTPTWDNDASLGLGSSRATEIGSDITALRSNGGDVTLSFGGEGGNELADYCGSVDALKAAYRSVIDKYQLTRIDFDIEGGNATNTAANLRRAQAVASLKQDLPNLKVFLTVAADTATGLDPAGQVLVKQMRDAGVPLAGVNIMTMYFGAGTDDGAATIASAKAAFNTLKSLYPTNTDAEIWASIMLTANIGLTADKTETFSLANAQQVHTWAAAQHIGALTMWSVERDQACSGSASLANDNCSGISQTQYQFMKTLNMAATVLGGSPTPAPITSGTPSPSPLPTISLGDINKDGSVNIFDLSILLGNWGKTGANSSDLNGDRTVNILDLSILLSHWTK